MRSHLYQSFSWPVAKLLRTELDVPVVGRSRMIVRTDDAIGRVLAISGAWEPSVTAAFEASLERGDVCVDVGAHIGYYTLLASKLVGPTGHVYAVEPSPTNFALLRRNLSRNHVTNVTALEVAAGETARTAVLYEGPGTNTGRATLNPIPAGRGKQRIEVTVAVRPVLTLLRESELVKVRAVKIDAEGCELEVLRSLVPLFELGKPLSVFMEYTPSWVEEDAAAAEDIVRICAAHGFALYRLRSGYTLEELFPRMVEPPERVAFIPPRHQCDLLLTRAAA